MRNWIIAVLLVLVGAAAYYYLRVYQPVEAEPPPPPPLAVTEPEPAEEQPAAESTPQPTPLPDTAPPEYEEIPLPMLAESDPVALESLGDLIGEPAVDSFLASDNVISRLVTTTDALGSRQVPGAIQAVRAPEGDFLALPNDQPEKIIRNEEGDIIPQFTLDPANYERYTPFVELLESADPARLAESYRRHYSLIQEAYRMQGYPEGEFNDRLVAVIDEILATPEVTGPVSLMKPEAYYLFVDPELEGLSAGQKILLRMGPSNAQRVKARLTAIRAELQ